METPLEQRLANRTHGKPATYVVGCRCEPCTLANSARAQERRDRLKAERLAREEQQAADRTRIASVPRAGKPVVKLQRPSGWPSHVWDCLEAAESSR